MHLILNPIGGLANRLRSIASGVALAAERNLVIDKVVWPIDRELHCPFGSLFLPLSDSISVESVGKMRDLWQYDRPRKQNLFFSGVVQAGRFAARLGDVNSVPSDLTDRLAETHKPLLIRNGLIYHDFTPGLYRQLFRPLPELAEKAADRTSGAIDLFGLHIRRTDNTEAIAHSPVGLFEDAVERRLESDAGARFYLATDDDGVKRRFLQRFGRERIITSETTASRTTAEGVREALVELLCLAGCRHIYGSYWSSYSQAAAWLGDTSVEALTKKP